MSEFLDAVAEWNRRLTDDGYRSAAVDLPCVKCQQAGVILTTIYGRTTALCPCGHTWLVVA
jgi:hypothetical protein